MRAFAVFVGYLGLAGAFLSGLIILWNAAQLALAGQSGLLANGFRFLDRKRHPDVARPYVGGIIRWFCVFAVCFVLFGVGVSVGAL